MQITKGRKITVQDGLWESSLDACRWNEEVRCRVTVFGVACGPYVSAPEVAPVHINRWRTRSREGCDGWVSVNIQPEESRPCHFLRENAGIGKWRFVRTRRRRSQVIIHVHRGRRLVRPLGDAASIWSLKREQYCSAAGRHINEGSDGIGGTGRGAPYISMAVSRSSRLKFGELASRGLIRLMKLSISCSTSGSWLST